MKAAPYPLPWFFFLSGSVIWWRVNRYSAFRSSSAVSIGENKLSVSEVAFARQHDVVNMIICRLIISDHSLVRGKRCWEMNNILFRWRKILIYQEVLAKVFGNFLTPTFLGYIGWCGFITKILHNFLFYSFYFSYHMYRSWNGKKKVGCLESLLE